MFGKDDQRDYAQRAVDDATTAHAREIAQAQDTVAVMAKVAARMRPVVEAARRQAFKARSVINVLREPLGRNNDYVMFTVDTNDAVDELERAEKGDGSAEDSDAIRS